MDYENLDDTFTWHDPIRENQPLAGKRVTVIDYPDGRIKIKYEGHELAYREFDKLTHTHQGEVVPTNNCERC